MDVKINLKNIINYFLVFILFIVNLWGDFINKILKFDSIYLTIINILIFLFLCMLYLLSSKFKVNKFLLIILILNIIIFCIHTIKFGFNVDGVKYVLYYFTFLLITIVFKRISFEYFKKIIVFSSVVICIDAIIKSQYVLSLHYKIYNVRNYTMLDKPYYTLICLFATIILFVEVLKINKKRIIKSFMILLFAFVNLFIIQGKMYIISLIIAFIVIYFTSNFEIKRNMRKIIIYSTIIILGYYILNPEAIPDYILVFLYKNFGININRDISSIYFETYSIRGEIIKYAMKLFMKYPLMGIGIGNYALYAQSGDIMHLGVYDAESSFLSVLVEGGLLNLILNLTILFIIFKEFYKNYKVCKENINFQISITLLISYIVLNTTNDFINLTYWITMGIIYGIFNNRKENLNDFR